MEINIFTSEAEQCDQTAKEKSWTEENSLLVNRVIGVFVICTREIFGLNNKFTKFNTFAVPFCFIIQQRKAN